MALVEQYHDIEREIDAEINQPGAPWMPETATVLHIK